MKLVNELRGLADLMDEGTAEAPFTVVAGGDAGVISSILRKAAVALEFQDSLKKTAISNALEFLDRTIRQNDIGRWIRSTSDTDLSAEERSRQAIALLFLAMTRKGVEPTGNLRKDGQTIQGIINPERAKEILRIGADDFGTNEVHFAVLLARAAGLDSKSVSSNSCYFHKEQDPISEADMDIP